MEFPWLPLEKESYVFLRRRKIAFLRIIAKIGYLPGCSSTGNSRDDRLPEDSPVKRRITITSDVNAASRKIATVNYRKLSFIRFRRLSVFRREEHLDRDK